MAKKTKTEVVVAEQPTMASGVEQDVAAPVNEAPAPKQKKSKKPKTTDITLEDVATRSGGILTSRIQRQLRPILSPPGFIMGRDAGTDTLKYMLPDDWMVHVTSLAEADVPSAMWPIVRCLRTIVQKHGTRSLCMEEVHDLARWSTTPPQARQGFCLQGYENGCNAIVASTGSRWPIDLAVADIEPGLRTANAVVNAQRSFDSMISELSVFETLRRSGWSPVRIMNRAGVGDWCFEHQGQNVRIDVKYKATHDRAGELISSLWSGMVRHARHALLQRCVWRWMPRDSDIDALAHLGRDKILEVVLRVLEQSAPSILAQLESGVDNESLHTQQGIITSDNGGSVPHEVGVKLGRDSYGVYVEVGCQHFSVVLSGMEEAPISGHEWDQHHPDFAPAEWIPPFIEINQLAETAEVLERVVGARIREDVLYLVIWPAPWHWGSALGDCERVAVRQILAEMCRIRPRCVFALVPTILGMEHMGIFLSEHAQRLLGISDWVIPYGAPAASRV